MSTEYDTKLIGVKTFVEVFHILHEILFWNENRSWNYFNVSNLTANITKNTIFVEMANLTSGLVGNIFVYIIPLFLW